MGEIINSKNKKRELKTPIVFIVFARPDKTQLVFNEIRKIKPIKLFVIADGPRNQEEWPRCKAVRDIIDKQVDWPCEVLKNYSDTNLNPKFRISSGLNWVFSQTEKAIIIEDDCLPDPSFFPFCEELLEKYRDNEQVMQISGYNFAVMDKNFKCDDSYYFSQIGLIAGWATWKRAWEHYDVNISKWPEIKQSRLIMKRLKNAAVADHYDYLFDKYYRGLINSWDSQWFLTRWVQGGVSIIPKTNLTSNIGFDADIAAFNRLDPDDARAHVPVNSIKFPLRHPNKISVNRKADNYVFKYALGINLFWSQKVKWVIKKYLPFIHKLSRALGGS